MVIWTRSGLIYSVAVLLFLRFKGAVSVQDEVHLTTPFCFDSLPD